MCLAQGPQRSDAGEARTRGLSISSQAKAMFAIMSTRENIRLFAEAPCLLLLPFTSLLQHSEDYARYCMCRSTLKQFPLIRFEIKQVL